MTYNIPDFGRIVANPVVYIISAIGLGIVAIMVFCCRICLQRFGLILLILFTLFMSILLSLAIAQYNSMTIMIAFINTFGLTVFLTIYACISIII